MIWKILVFTDFTEKKLFIRALLSNNFFMKSGFWRKIISSRGKYCSSQSRSRYSYCLAIKCKCLCHFKLPFRWPIKRMNSKANNKVFCFNSLCMLIAFTLFIKGWHRYTKWLCFCCCQLPRRLQSSFLSNRFSKIIKDS